VKNSLMSPNIGRYYGKFSLIDLELQKWTTGRKQDKKSVQRERLSEKTSQVDDAIV
jgi:hypothetical protein